MLRYHTAVESFTTSRIIPATPQHIYECWIDADNHSEMTGAGASSDPKVGGAFTAWNFPAALPARKLAPALAMGNTCIIKPAPQDPLGVLRLGEAVVEAGFPPGVVNILTTSGVEASAALVASPDVNMVSFTGSSAVGKRIMADGAASMTRVLMELGGKGAMVMTEDADVNAAVGAIASVWGFHSGQICTAPTRVICHRSIYDQTVEFVGNEVTPHGDGWELDGMVPREVLARMGGLGMLSLRIPEELGGLGMGMLASAVFSEALGSSTYAGFDVTVLVHTDMAGPHLVNSGSPEQHERWLPGVLAIPFVGKAQDYAINRREWNRDDEL